MFSLKVMLAFQNQTQKMYIAYKGIVLQPICVKCKYAIFECRYHYLIAE